MFKVLRAAILLAVVVLPAIALASEFTDKQRAELGALIREYLLKNPEVLVEISEELQKRQRLSEETQRSETLAANAAEIFHGSNDLVAGNPKGAITMVEFFDYNCSWCKKGMPEVLRLLETDKDLRLVLKEFPIFGEDSEYAARAALASRAQGKYWKFHLALLGHDGQLTKDNVDEIAGQQGLDVAKMKADMDVPTIRDQVSRNQELAKALAINGTPAFIVDQKVIPGYLPHDGLLAAVTEVRDAGGCKIC